VLFCYFNTSNEQLFNASLSPMNPSSLEIDIWLRRTKGSALQKIYKNEETDHPRSHTGNFNSL
ncbi:MAG: hypothetical protein LC655_04480, partial [Bacteroidales bacterium]|nr:hypothetical protein [Bacteroidales bacterium]